MREREIETHRGRERERERERDRASERERESERERAHEKEEWNVEMGNEKSMCPTAIRAHVLVGTN